jgi:hypothetical protein
VSHYDRIPTILFSSVEQVERGRCAACGFVVGVYISVGCARLCVTEYPTYLTKRYVRRDQSSCVRVPQIVQAKVSQARFTTSCSERLLDVVLDTKDQCIRVFRTLLV